MGSTLNDYIGGVMCPVCARNALRTKGVMDFFARYLDGVRKMCYIPYRLCQACRH
jgi:hypothetical protein